MLIPQHMTMSKFTHFRNQIPVFLLFFISLSALISLAATANRRIDDDPPIPTTHVSHVHPQMLSRRLLLVHSATLPTPSASPFKNISSHFNKSTTTTLKMAQSIDVSKLRLEFLQVLRSRRTPEVPLQVVPGKPVEDPLYQESPKPVFKEEILKACPKKEIPNFKELLKEENFYLTTEAGEQGRLPVLILSLKESSEKKRPTVIFNHSTKKCKEWFRPILECYASRGYVAVAIDSRYHGERASNMTTYRDALVAAWKNGDTMPFLFDTVWDLIKLADYLTQREDVDPSRIGITGESLGGMHAWLAGFLDPRYSVVVPTIGVQGFGWAIENDKWQGRVDSIKDVFEAAKNDLGKSSIDKEVVKQVWDRIAPGLDSIFDSPYTIPAIAPRPLLILNGEEDPRCPIEGLAVPKAKTIEAYKQANCVDNFKLVLQPGIGHQVTPFMVKETSEWFDKFYIL